MSWDIRAEPRESFPVEAAPPAENVLPLFGRHRFELGERRVGRAPPARHRRDETRYRRSRVPVERAQVDRADLQAGDRPGRCDRRHRGEDDRAGQSVTRSISLFNRAVMPSFIEGISSMRP
jgi:hypothetical protein